MEKDRCTQPYDPLGMKVTENFRSTKVQPFVPEAEDGVPAEGSGDKTHGYQQGTWSSPSGKDRCISVDSLAGGGVHQLVRGGGGTNGPGAKSTGQKTSVSETASPGDGGDTAGDERHLKPPKFQRRLRRPWTARLRDLLLPRHRRKATVVLPLDKSQGSAVDRQPGSLGGNCIGGYQSHGDGALKPRSEVKVVKGKRSQTVRNRCDEVVTRSKVTPHFDQFQLPGVPQLNLDSISESDESDNDGSGLTLGQEFECAIAGCGDQPHVAAGRYDTSPPATSFASSVRPGVMKTSSHASSLKKKKITTASNSCDDGLLDASRKDVALSPPSKKEGTVSDIASRGDAPSSSVYPTESIRQGVKTQEQKLPKAPKLLNREKEEAIFREHRFALGMNVGFIFESLVGCQGYPDCRWLDVMRSCILRKEELRSLVLDGKQIMPYTKYELETINMNAILAIDRIYQLNKLVYEHVKQKNHGVRNMRLFEPVEKLLSDEPSVSDGNGRQAGQQGVRTNRLSPQPPSEAKTATRTGQAALPKTVVTVTQGKLKKGVVVTVSKSEDNFLIPRKATLVKRQKEKFIPSMKTTARKLPNLKQKAQGGNRHVSRSKPSQRMNAQNSNSARARCQNNTAAAKQREVATTNNEQEAFSNVQANPPVMEKTSQPKNSSNTVQAAPTEYPRCSKATSAVLVSKVGATPAAKSSSSTKPTAGTTIPKIAPSCLKKLMPNVPPYPSLDPADLEHVNDTDGNKAILGRGNFAEVFLMRRLSDNTLVALKRLKKDHFRLTADIDMLQEVTALQAVRHSSYFPKLYGVVDFRSYAQELLGDGSDNSARTFTKARFDLSLLYRGEWLHVCRDITKAMMDLHRVGWLHNDLHTGNAMVCRNPPGTKFKWMGKMIDLGCAQSIYSLAPPLTLTKEQKQSFYQHAIQVAPEVVEGVTGYTVQSDIYSLGRLFLTVAHDASCLSPLRLLGLSCMKRDPKLRPKLKTVYKKLNAICSKTKTASNEQPLS